MESLVSIRPLSEEKYRPAFALLDIAGIELSLEQWCDLARRLCQENEELRAGIMSVENERGHIYGLFSYVLDEQKGACRRVRSDYFIAPNYHGATVTELMIRSLEKIAQRNDCDEVIIKLSEPMYNKARPLEPGFGSSLSQVGYRLTRATFAKHLRNG